MIRIPVMLALAMAATNGAGEKPTIADKGLEIPTEEIDVVKSDALNGSGASAFRLYNYYEIVSVNREKSMYWATISAENDFPAGMYALGFKLAQEAGKESKMRARYWLKKAKNNGEPLADDVLRELDK